MKSKLNFFGLAAFVVLIAFSIAACGGGSDPSSPGNTGGNPVGGGSVISLTVSDNTSWI